MNRLIPRPPIRRAWRALVVGLMLGHAVPFILQSAAQTSGKGKRQNQVTYSTKRKALLREGAEALAKEKALEKDERCDVPEAIHVCLERESDLVQRNYAAYVAAIEALLDLNAAEYRQNVRDVLEGTPDVAQELKAAEALWTRSVELQCSAAGDQYWGGSLRPVVIMECRIKLTQQHVQYLADFYGVLWEDEP